MNSCPPNDSNGWVTATRELLHQLPLGAVIKASTGHRSAYAGEVLTLKKRQHGGLPTWFILREGLPEDSMTISDTHVVAYRIESVPNHAPNPTLADELESTRAERDEMRTLLTKVAKAATDQHIDDTDFRATAVEWLHPYEPRCGSVMLAIAGEVICNLPPHPVERAHHGVAVVSEDLSVDIIWSIV